MERTQIAALVMSSQPAQGGKKVSTLMSPLSPMAGKSVLGWVVDAALGASIRRVAIVTDDATRGAEADLADRADRAMIEFVSRQRDVADTVAYALERLGSGITLQEGSHVLVLPGEAPQLEAGELRDLIHSHMHSGAAATLLAGRRDPDAHVHADPALDEGRDDDSVVAISDASADLVGVLCISASLLVPVLRRVHTPRWQRMLPLGDIVRVLHEIGHDVDAITREAPIELVTTAANRSAIEMQLHDRVIARWTDRGASMPDPRQVTIDATVTLGQGVRVLPGSLLQGSTVVGDGATIGPNTQLINAHVGAGAIVPHSVVANAEVDANEHLPPFSVLGSAST